MKNITLVRGIPGSGKSTIAGLMSSNATIIAADDYFTVDDKYNFDRSKLSEAHTWCQNTVEILMGSDVNIVVHNTFTTVDEMQPYFNLAKQYNYTVHTIIVENRHNSQSIHNVPNEVITRMVDRFDIQLTPPDESSNYTKLVKIKEFGDLKLHKYDRKVFYKNLWHKDEKLLDARGLVVDNNDNIIQYPFTKIFNFGENNTKIHRDTQVTAVKKINGFMAAVTLHNNEILVSTTGSLDSPFVEMAKEILPMDTIKEHLSSNITYCFEIVHPNDPHIIPETIGAYLIGGRVKQYGSSQIPLHELHVTALNMGVNPPEWYHDIFGNVVKDVKNVYHEGYVIYSSDGTVLKLKAPYYLTHKFIARCKDMNKLFSKNYKRHVDEEFYDLIAWLQQNYQKEEFDQIDEQTRLKIVRDFANKNIDITL